MSGKSKTEILNWLYSLQRFGIKPGLERISGLLKYLGNPENQFKSIHITGTNGKGTTSVNIASILKEANFKIGLYTSPHLVDFNERIQINGVMIDDDILIDYADSLRNIQEKTNATFFELTTAIAFKYFAENNVNFAVIEAGMGGQNDATNVIHPLLSIITQISLEHQEYLGNTLEEIARDKAGIIKQNSTSLISGNNLKLKEIFHQVAKEKNNEIHFLNDYKYDLSTEINDFKTNINLTLLDNLQYKFSTPFIGNNQIRNLLTSLFSIKLLQKQVAIPEKAIILGLENIQNNFYFKGRFQLITKNPLIICDTAHNPAAFQNLIHQKNLINQNSQMDLVIALMKDKDINSIAKIIKNEFKNIIITQPKIQRAATTDELFEIFKENGFSDKNIFQFKETKDTIDFVRRNNRPTIFAGSFYLIGEILPLLENSFV